MKGIICTAVILGFVALGYYATKHADQHKHHAETSYTVSQIKAMDKFVAVKLSDSGMAYKADKQRDCGADWLCLIAWANEQHPTKRKKS